MTNIAQAARVTGAGALLFLGLSLPASLALSSVGLGLASFCALLLVLTDRESRRALAPLRWIAGGVLLWVTSYAVAAAFSEQPHWKKISDELWIRLLLFVPTVLLAARPAWARRNLRWMLFMAALVAAFAISQHFHGRDVWRGGTVNTYGDRYQSVGFFGHHLSYGGHVMLMALTALACAWNRLPRTPVWAALSAVFLVALAWTFSRSSQLGFLAGAAYLLLFSPHGRRRWKLTAFVLALAAALLLPDVRDRALSLFRLEEEPTRILLWRASWDAFLASPWLGYGPGNFGVVLRDFRHSGFYDSTAHAHSDYLMLLLNGGLTALFAFALTTWALYRRLRAADPRDAAWMLAARAGWVAILVAGLFQFYQADDEVEFALFFLLGHALALGARATASGESPGA